MTFTLVSGALPSNNGSFGDLNNDGFIDGFTGGNIYVNGGNANNWITINTEGVESNRNGIGARVKVTSALGSQIRDVRSGEGFRFMSTLNTHFGLGADTEITNITITWPSGIVDTLDDVAVNQVLTVVEGSTVLGTQDFETNSLVVYPNPVDDIINLSQIEDFNNPAFAIYDLQGKLIMASTIKNASIDVSTLASGNYILKVYDGEQTKTQKIIKR